MLRRVSEGKRKLSVNDKFLDFTALWIMHCMIKLLLLSLVILSKWGSGDLVTNLFQCFIIGTEVQKYSRYSSFYYLGIFFSWFIRMSLSESSIKNEMGWVYSCCGLQSLSPLDEKVRRGRRDFWKSSSNNDNTETNGINFYRIFIWKW